MDTLGLDTIAGAKLLQLKFGSFGTFQPDQAVMHEGRRARFIRIGDGVAVIRHCGGSDAVTVPLETLSLPPEEQEYPALRRTARTDARQAWSSTNPPGTGVRAGLDRRSHRRPQGRPLLRP